MKLEKKKYNNNRKKTLNIFYDIVNKNNKLNKKQKKELKNFTILSEIYKSSDCVHICLQDYSPHCKLNVFYVFHNKISFGDYFQFIMTIIILM
jgi:enterochelin esterase-like enzyme